MEKYTAGPTKVQKEKPMCPEMKRVKHTWNCNSVICFWRTAMMVKFAASLSCSSFCWGKDKHLLNSPKHSSKWSHNTSSKVTFSVLKLDLNSSESFRLPPTHQISPYGAELFCSDINASSCLFHCKVRYSVGIFLQNHFCIKELIDKCNVEAWSECELRQHLKIWPTEWERCYHIDLLLEKQKIPVPSKLFGWSTDRPLLHMCVICHVMNKWNSRWSEL